MRLHNIFIPLLITGVLSFGQAQPQGQNYFQDYCRKLLQYGTIEQFRIYGCTPIVEASNPLEEFFRGKCEKNGSPFSYDNAVRSLGFFGRCVGDVIDAPQIAIDFRSVRSKQGSRNIYQQYCRRLPILTECIKYTTQSIESCLEGWDERTTAQTIFYVADTFFNYICNGDGERLEGIEEPSSLECISSKVDAIRSCANESFSDYVPATLLVTPRTQGLGRLATPLIISNEDCTNLDNFQNCTVQLLAECENKAPANLLNSVLNAMKIHTPCRNMLEIEGLGPIGNLLADNETEIVNSTMSSDIANSTIWSEIDNSTIWSEIDNSTIWSEIENSTATSEIYPKVSGQSIAEFLVENCEKNGGPRAFHAAIRVPQDLENCLKSVVDMEQLQGELQAASPIDGSVNRVFAKYCRKVSNINKCIRRATKAIKPCMEPEVQEKIDVINNVTRALTRFSCQGHGDRLAAFMIEGGPQCMGSKKEALDDCATQVFSGYGPASHIGGFGKFQIMLNLATEDCADMMEFKRCVVRTLQECEDTATANVVDSLMRSLIKATPCKDSLRR